MKKKILAGQCMVTLENKEKMKLEYYLLEEVRDTELVLPLYGIQIVKKQNGRRGKLQEKETAAALSYSREQVEAMLDCMVNHTVTPVGMLAVVDDWMSEGRYLNDRDLMIQAT